MKGPIIRTNAVGTLLALSAALLGGCGPAGLIRRGDASLQANRPHEAVQFYRQALQEKPDLAEAPEFTARVDRARCLAAYQDGQRLAEQKNWEYALEKFSECLRIDPSFEQASAALRQARTEGSGSLHKDALAAADEGRLDQAAEALTRAQRIDPENAHVRAALGSLTAGSQDPAVQRRYVEAMALKDKRDWLKAAAAFQAVVAADADHLPARSALRSCNDALAQARERYAGGSRLLSERRLDQAIAAMKEAVELWPSYDEADALLAQAQDQRRQFDDLYGQGTKLFQAGRYEAAVQSAEAAVRIYPHHGEARELIRQAKLHAAAVLVEAGQGLIAKGELGAAEKQFNAALEYVQEMQAAKDGLAQVYFLRGQAAERQSLAGNALLWYLAATEQAAGDEYRLAARAARQAVTERLAFRLAVDSDDADLRTRLGGVLLAERPAFVTLMAGGAGAAADYAAAVELRELNVRDRLVRTEQRVHRYTIERNFPNPEIPRLRLLLAEAQRDLERLREAYKRECRHCRGTGRLTCGRCDGKGVIPCGKCEGKGHVVCPDCKGKGTVAGSICPTCKALRRVSCPACEGTGSRYCPACSTARQKRGWVPCRQCDGTGRLSKVRKSDIAEKEEQVRRLSGELARGPLMITRQAVAEWPYAVLFYEKTGTLSANVRLIDAASRQVLASRTISKSAGYEDSALSQANPAVGLAADALELPSDGEVHSALLEAAAADAARQLLADAIEARIARFNAEARRLEQAGKTDQAIEALVNVAVLMESAEPTEAAKLFKKLREMTAEAPAVPSKAP